MKIALLGYGKMGKAIEQAALDRGHEILLKITSQNLEEFNKENLQQVDVAIEFSAPEYALLNIEKCLQFGIPIAVGTTGWNKHEDAINKKVNELNGSFLAASNFSVGVNIFFEINRRLAELMGNQRSYSTEIQEIHHTEKLDSPSGTAITLAEGILEKHSTYNKWVNESNESKDALEIISFREPGVPGTHEVSYSSDIDKITIKHEANNRKGFALGAVLAAEYIHNKKGIFTMQDVLKN